MFCGNCGKKNEEGAKFCKFCGSPMKDERGGQPGQDNAGGCGNRNRSAAGSAGRTTCAGTECKEKRRRDGSGVWERQ